MQLPKCVPKYSAVIAERVWEEGDTEWAMAAFFLYASLAFSPYTSGWNYVTQGQLFSLYVTWA